MVSHGTAADLSGEPLDKRLLWPVLLPWTGIRVVSRGFSSSSSRTFGRGWRLCRTLGAISGEMAQPSNIGNIGPQTPLGEAALYAKRVASGVGRVHVPGHPDDSGEWGNGPWSAGVNVAPANAVEMNDEPWSVAVMNDALVNDRLMIVVGGDQYVCCGPLLCPCRLS